MRLSNSQAHELHQHSMAFVIVTFWMPRYKDKGPDRNDLDSDLADPADPVDHSTLAVTDLCQLHNAFYNRLMIVSLP